MAFNFILFLILLVYAAIFAAVVYLFILIVRALKKYISSKEIRTENREVRLSLAETLRANRTRCKMTQEFVAEAVGVSRQAVSKWENGTADPTMPNLIALAKIYGITPEELLRCCMGNAAQPNGETEET